MWSEIPSAIRFRVPDHVSSGLVEGKARTRPLPTRTGSMVGDKGNNRQAAMDRSSRNRHVISSPARRVFRVGGQQRRVTPEGDCLRQICRHPIQLRPKQDAPSVPVASRLVRLRASCPGDQRLSTEIRANLVIRLSRSVLLASNTGIRWPLSRQAYLTAYGHASQLQRFSSPLTPSAPLSPRTGIEIESPTRRAGH